MAAVKFQRLEPILGARDVERAVRFYVDQLGFTLAFRDGLTPTNYLGLRRDGVEVHVQFQHEYEMAAARLRFGVDDPDALCAEFQSRGVEIAAPLSDKPWGTREFALYDPDGNALTFYKRVA